ncbi:MAG: decaprenyl-phosphate phosphoribosyltransferase [Deferribacterales bacterium]
MRNIIVLMRPHQWIKNIFVLAPMFFAQHFTADGVMRSFAAFGLFCMAASSIYILNDWHDIEEDREHPVKRNRPLASGAVSKPTALILMAVLAAVAVILSYFIALWLCIVIIMYIVMNILYTYKLKHVSVLDISVIAFGFVLRIFAGSFAMRIPTSTWIIMVTFQLALFLALAKRRDDVLLALEGKQTRKNIDGYNAEMINASMVFMAAVTVVSYIMYTVAPETVSRFGTRHLYLSSFFVITGILRYMQITFVENRSGSPTMLVYTDRFLQLIIAGWLASFILIPKL